MGLTVTPRWRIRRLPKQGHDWAEYEDACAHHAQGCRFAVADGASESAYARQWAELLVQRFVATPLAQVAQWEEWLAPLQQQWQAAVEGPARPWYAEAKVEQGAFAAFLGFALTHGDRWEAVAVGDCCLFQLRADALRTAFPVTRADDFSCRPALVGSRVPAGPRGAWARGDAQRGDRFLLMSDALACWYLGSCEAGAAPWPTAAALVEATDEEFATRIAQLRASRQLHNDDVTLVHLLLD